MRAPDKTYRQVRVAYTWDLGEDGPEFTKPFTHKTRIKATSVRVLVEMGTFSVTRTRTTTEITGLRILTSGEHGAEVRTRVPISGGDDVAWTEEYTDEADRLYREREGEPHA